MSKSQPGAVESAPTTHTRLSEGEFVALMAALMSLNALAIDIMLPALPFMGDALGVADPNHRQYVIIAYVLGLGVAQLFFGPASDRYGRRAPLLVSLAGYSFFGAMCIFASSFEMLVAARALQGVAASGARAISMSVIRDVHAGRKMARIMSLVVMVFMAVPMLAPNLGQAILWVASWRWIFGVLVGSGVVMVLWVGLRLDETLPSERRRPLDLNALATSYSLVFRTRVTFGYMLALGVIFGALFSFISSSEQVYGDVYGKKQTFSLYFATVAAAMAVAAFLNSRLVGRWGMRRLSHLALVAFTLVNALLVTVLHQGISALWLFHGCMLASFFCFAFLGANFNALAMEPLGHVAGTASAALGFASTVIAGVIGGALGQQFDGTVVPVATGFLVLGALSLLILLVTERGKLFGDDAAAVPREDPASA